MTTGRINQVTTESRVAGRWGRRRRNQSSMKTTERGTSDRLARRSFVLLRVCHEQQTTVASVVVVVFVRVRRPRQRSPRTAAFFGSPPEHSLRGRNIQDCRALNRTTQARYLRSVRTGHCDARSPETLQQRVGVPVVRPSLGRRTAMPPTGEQARTSNLMKNIRP
jgi:hypothetical protein